MRKLGQEFRAQLTGRPTDHRSIEMSLKLLNDAEEGLDKKEIEKKRSLSFWKLFKVLRPYFWPDAGSDGAFINRIRSSVTWLLVALSKATSLISPFYIIEASNQLIAGNYMKAVIASIAYCGLKLASSILKELQGLVYIKVKQQANIELQEITFKHIHTLSLNWHLTKKTGSVVKAMDRGVDATDTLVTMLFLYLVPALLECLAVVIIFYVEYAQYLIGSIVFTGVLLYILLTVVITKWRKNLRDVTNKHDNDYHDKATDSIINFETIKYFTGEEFELKRFKASVVQYQQFSSSTRLANSILNIVQQFILYATLVGVMIVAASSVVHGTMGIGEWIAMQSWVGTIFAPLNFLGSIYGAVVQAMIDIKNLSELLAEEPDVKDMEGAHDIPRHPISSNPRNQILASSSISLLSSPTHNHSLQGNGINGSSSKVSDVSVEFHNVSFRYPGQDRNHGIQNISFKVEAGTATAIVGSTGAGKTTISRLLFRFYDPISGQITLNGYDIKQYTQKSVRGLIGVVPQDTVLFNDTILYNIQYGCREASFEQVVQAAKAAQIYPFIESLPEKWDTVVGERGLKLSGGEKQRVAIARCLLKDPPVVLLDEATSALDILTENSVQEALYALGQNRTVIIIAHRLSTVKYANQIIVMDEGQIAERGSHEELLVLNGRYAKLWNMQLIRADSSLLDYSNSNPTSQTSLNTTTDSLV